MNSIYLRRQLKVHVKEGTNQLPASYIAALQKNIGDLGFGLSRPLCDRLQTLSVESLAVFYKQLVKDLRVKVGAHRQFNPMYPNFPEQVMEMSAARLYLNALIHYATNRLPAHEKEERPSLADETKLRIVELGSREYGANKFAHAFFFAHPSPGRISAGTAGCGVHFCRRRWPYAI